MIVVGLRWTVNFLKFHFGWCTGFANPSVTWHTRSDRLGVPSPLVPLISYNITSFATAGVEGRRGGGVPSPAPLPPSLYSVVNVHGISRPHWDPHRIGTAKSLREGPILPYARENQWRPLADSAPFPPFSPFSSPFPSPLFPFPSVYLFWSHGLGSLICMQGWSLIY